MLENAADHHRAHAGVPASLDQDVQFPPGTAPITLKVAGGSPTPV